MNNAQQTEESASTSQMKVSVQTYGNENNKIIVIDHFHSNPETLLTLAETEPHFAGQSSDFYPGIRKIIESEYAEQTLAAVAPIIRDIFKPNAALRAQQNLCAFSLATTPTHQLRPIQCVPHIDTHDNNQFALVHYLCSAPYKGTSIYRHKSTGFETINSDRLEGYFKILKQEVTSGGLPNFDYINGDTVLFERIGNIELVFNRAVIYHSNLLHSGNISEAIGLSNNPREGRLTANMFICFS
jgi:hypothetical protein